MSKEIETFNKEYALFLKEIKTRIISARVKTSRLINKGLLQLYWDIGKKIVARQKQYGWGQGVVERLAVDLAEDFKGFEGFSPNNLWRIRNFYLAYKDNSKLAQLVQEIPSEYGQEIVVSAIRQSY